VTPVSDAAVLRQPVEMTSFGKAPCVLTSTLPSKAKSIQCNIGDSAKQFQILRQYEVSAFRIVEKSHQKLRKRRGACNLPRRFSFILANCKGFTNN
jgi:hypothetical protein